MADVELLPLPKCDVDYTVSYSRAAMRAYARANLAPLQAENERLRAEVERLRRLVQEREAMLGRRLCSGTNADGKPRCLVLAEERARADRLADALMEYGLPLTGDYTHDVLEFGHEAVAREERRRAALAKEDRND